MSNRSKVNRNVIGKKTTHNELLHMRITKLENLVEEFREGMANSVKIQTLAVVGILNEIADRLPTWEGDLPEKCLKLTSNIWSMDGKLYNYEYKEEPKDESTESKDGGSGEQTTVAAE